MDWLWHDFDAREVTLAPGRRGAARGQPAAERRRPRRRHLLLRLPDADAGEGGRGDQLPRHQRHQAPAAGLAAGAVLGPAGGGRRLRRHRPDRPAARRLPAEDDAPARRPPDVVATCCTRSPARSSSTSTRTRTRGWSPWTSPTRSSPPSPAGARAARAPARTGFAADQPAFGTILKPTAGITPDDVGRIVDEVAGCPLLMFIKEDEDLYPNLDYSPVAERTRRAWRRSSAPRTLAGGSG